ncbi:MAG: lysophospholipid acyltransferase family protein [Burkholderiaceae bacterium]|nr:lysophospholipid acyltransferase family protein [Burkholderiaceae bacterium]
MKLLFRMVAALPLRVVHAIAGLLGRMVFWLSPAYRRRLRENLASAGYGDPALAVLAAAEAGKQALEAPWIWMRPRAELLDGLIEEPANLSVLDAMLRDDRPIVFLTPHLGCFEVTTHWFAASVSPSLRRQLTVLYRVPRKSVLRGVLAEARASEGVAPVPADISGVRKLMRAMKRGEAVGILPDQVPSRGEGTWAPFFGRAAYTMTLPAKLARQFDGVVAFVWGERLSRGRGWRIHLKRLEEPFTGDSAQDAAIVNRGLEALIRQCPAQYLWGYNRYKAPAGAASPTSRPPT